MKDGIETSFVRTENNKTARRSDGKLMTKHDTALKYVNCEMFAKVSGHITILVFGRSVENMPCVQLPAND